MLLYFFHMCLKLVYPFRISSFHAHHLQGGQECPIYMRTGGCESASRCRFHHPDPTAVVGDILQDRKNGVPSQHQGPVEQLYGTPRPSEDTSNEQTAFLGPFTPNRGIQQNVYWIGNPVILV